MYLLLKSRREHRSVLRLASALRSKLILMLACLVCVASVTAAPAQSPALAGIAHAAIRVGDIDRSRAFYERLGFQVAFSMSKEGKPTEVFFKINDRQFLEIYPISQPSQKIGFMHVCFEAADLQALYDAYVAHGLTPTPVKRAGAGNLLFTLKGPEEQNIEYTQYMPGSMHWNDRGKNLGPDRIAQQIAGLSVAMQDPKSAETFYLEKLGFRAASRHLQHGGIALDLPGISGEKLQLTSSVPFQLFLSVPNTARAAAQLKTLHISFHKQHSILTIKDPDGNEIVLIATQG